MQDATLFEKSSPTLLASAQLSNTSNDIGKSSENTSASPKIEMDDINDNPERLKNSNTNASGQKVSSDTAQVGAGVPTASQSLPPIMWPSAAVPIATPEAEETYIQNISSLSNGGMSFQHFPTVSPSSAMYHSGITFSANQPANAILSQQGRRAITGHNSVNSFSRQQTALMVNTCSSPKMLPNWNNSHQTSWSPPQPQASLYPPWNVQQRRSVPNMNAVAAAVKKQTLQQQLQQPSFVSPSKFRRSTSFPGQIQASVGVKNPYDFTTFDDVLTYQVVFTVIFRCYFECQFGDITSLFHVFIVN